MKVEVEPLIQAMRAQGYRVFESEMSLNLIGIRNKNMTSNTFNDLFCVLYKQRGTWQLETFDCTTDPGTYYRQHPMNVKGTAVVVPGQYRSLWTFGMHQGNYPALVQNQEITVYRDNNHDQNVDETGPVESGFFGINCHRANANLASKRVDRWSAGCQVLAKPFEFQRVLHLCRLSANEWGNTFTYTLLTQLQLEQHHG